MTEVIDQPDKRGFRFRKLRTIYKCGHKRHADIMAFHPKAIDKVDEIIRSGERYQVSHLCGKCQMNGGKHD